MVASKKRATYYKLIRESGRAAKFLLKRNLIATFFQVRGNYRPLQMKAT